MGLGSLRPKASACALLARSMSCLIAAWSGVTPARAVSPTVEGAWAAAGGTSIGDVPRWLIASGSMDATPRACGRPQATSSTARTASEHQRLIARLPVVLAVLAVVVNGQGHTLV